MPTLGTGFIPTGQIANELTAVTLRSFINGMVYQIGNARPTLAALIARAQDAGGGISSITAPVQGAPMVTPSYTDFSGSFTQPTVQSGIQNAEWNLAVSVAPIAFLGMEGLIQVDHAVVPLMEARFNDATQQLLAMFSGSVFNNGTDTQQILGLPAAADDGTNVSTYGGISRTNNTWWQSLYVHNASATAPTRNLAIQWLNQSVKHSGGEIPNFGVMGLGTWTSLAQDFTSAERYNTSPNASYGAEKPASALFRALDVGGVPFFADPDCPEGYLYLLNTRYLALYMHRNARFSFTGFQSTMVNNALGYVGVVVTALQMACLKPRSVAQINNLSYVFS